MKKKIIGILALSLLFSSCSMTKDTYVSKRHPEDNTISESIDEESTEIKYTTSEEGENQMEDTSQDQEDSQVTEEDQTDEDNVDGIEFTANSNVNMRLGPSTNSSIVVEVPGGSTIIKIGENGEWTRATYEGYTGYILSELLTPVN